MKRASGSQTGRDRATASMERGSSPPVECAQSFWSFVQTSDAGERARNDASARPHLVGAICRLPSFLCMRDAWAPRSDRESDSDPASTTAFGADVVFSQSSTLKLDVVADVDTPRRSGLLSDAYALG